MVLVHAIREESGGFFVGLIFIREKINNKSLVFRCLETKERFKLEIPEDYRNQGLPSYRIDETLKELPNGKH